MPSLASMRQLDPAGDGMQPPGPPVREVREAPKPAPKPTGTPGVVQMPDGKLQTNLPLPTQKPTVWVLVSIYAPDLTQDAIEESCKQIEFTRLQMRGKSLLGTELCARIISASPIPPNFTGKRADVIVFDDIEELP